MYEIIIQQAGAKDLSPAPGLLRKWAKAALKSTVEEGEITIRIVDEAEMAALNQQYRRKSGPTNVLSFPFETHADIDLETPILGDIVICSEVVNREASEQKKEVNAHWAHMIVHGVLHLLGYDHHTDTEAQEMENLEISVLKKLGFDNDPYLIND